MEYKDTLNLPRTDFSMRANLPTREPELLARWAEMGLYEAIQQAGSILAEPFPASADDTDELCNAIRFID